jgi:hypothetical protein
MTSYEFEVAAKNAVIRLTKEKYGFEFDITQVQIVWFAHMLGNKKAILITIGPDNRIYEVTYNREDDEMYIDCYSKCYNSATDIDTTVHVKGE